jgi:methionyl-tRNA synthetase
MTQSQLERAMEMLYGDMSARDELTDDEAQVLLKWGEDQIAQLSAQDMNDAEFDEALEHLTKLLTRINRFTARRADLPPEEQQDFIGKISASAEAVAAYTPTAQVVTPPNFDTYLQQQSTLDNIANIQALTALIAPPTPGAQSDDQTSNPTDQTGPQFDSGESQTSCEG